MRAKIRTILTLILFFYTFFYISHSFAVRSPRPTPIDSRIKVIVYSPDDVFKFTGYYGYQSSIELSKDEEVASISMGDTTSWQIVPSGNRIFIKPTELDATTNMTLITNKRTYLFELYGEHAQDIRDPDMAFILRFIYPDEEGRGSSIKEYASSSEDVLDMSHPEQYNFNYTLSGYEDIAPIKVFDDGQFTYMQFRNRNNEIPAILAVDEDLKESLVNYRPSKADENLIIIERVYKKLALRADPKVVCIFNEAYRVD